MATDDTTVEESREQPLEDSTQEDQPDTGESSEESEELLDDDDNISEEDQPDEESEEEISVEIDGEKLSLDELKAGYLRNKDYTQKTQALADMRKGLDEKPKKELSPEEKQVMEFLNKYGIVTEEKLTQKMSLEQAKALDMQNFNSWKSSSSATAEKAEAVYNLGKSFPKLSYAEIDKKFFGATATKKVVKRKVVGMKGKSSGNKTASRGFTREQIATMPLDVYKKNEAAIKEAMRKGEIS